MLVQRGLAATRERAQALIRSGQVLVDDEVWDKPGRQVIAGSELRLRSRLPYVSRGGVKLEAALEAFGLEVSGSVVVDIGASTGGFTDCLLQRGAARVYAVDVGYGQLAWKLRQDQRVQVMERTNIRYLEGLPEPVDLATIDVSFIGLELVLPVAHGLLKPGGQIVALVKPQFEAGRHHVRKGGVVRDPDIHLQVLTRLTGWAEEHHLRTLGVIRSPLRGPKGNVEFLLHLAPLQEGSVAHDRQRMRDAALVVLFGTPAGPLEEPGV